MIKVLVIEDDPAIRANIRDLLELQGFEVVLAVNGREGVERFRSERPALVICDLKLPELDGFGVLETLRNEAEGGDTPFIFLSAHAERAQIRKGMKLGADDYLPKPFTSRELLDAIQGRLERLERIRSQTPPPRNSTPAPFDAEATRPRGGALSNDAHGAAKEDERYGSYRVVAPLGHGGMGAVYIAEHVLIGKQVAIKVLLPELSQSRESVSRFFNEARSAASIRDPGIVEVFDFGYDSKDNAYIVMELLKGESLRERLTREPRPPLSFVCSVGRQIARVMGAAHAQHIVHRDLKPDNIFLVDDPDMPLGFRVKVLDFGIAKLGALAGPTSIVTKNGALLGTPFYMSPEQCRGLGEVDHRTDIYALGCILYEMVCGHPPFTTGGVGLIIGSHIYQPVPKPSSLVNDVDVELEAVLLKALAKEPNDRYATMQELASALAPIAERA